MKRSIGRFAVVGLGALTVASALVAGGTGAAHAATPPYEPTDNAKGTVSLLTSTGAAVASGKLDAAPFATYAVGSAALRAGDTQAALFICLPNPSKPASEWTCGQLSAYTAYPAAGAPTAVGSATGPVATITAADQTLSSFVSTHPNTTGADAGDYQLRLRTSPGTPSNDTPTTTYDAGDISVNTAADSFQVIYPTPAVTAISPAVAGDFVPLTPSRILDTRIGTGAPEAPAKAGSITTIHVTGAGGIPSTGVSAVVLNVTAVAPAAVGNLRVFPGGGAVPTVSNVNYTRGQTVANAVVVPVSSTGTVSIYTVAQSNILADVSGYFLGSPGAVNTTNGAFSGVTPTRILNSTAVAAGTAKLLTVTGQGGVPSTGVSAVVLNVTAVTPSGVGNIRVYPASAAVPTISNINYVKGQTVPNLVVVPVNAAGQVDLYTVAKANLIVDVQGYFSGDGTQPMTSGAFVPVSPARILDTRLGVGAPKRVVAAKGTVTLQVDGAGGIPASGVGAVVANVTAVVPSALGFVTVTPAGVARPLVSNVSYAKGETVAGSAFESVSTAGVADLYSLASTNLLEDVSGYFLGAANTTS